MTAIEGRILPLNKANTAPVFAPDGQTAPWCLYPCGSGQLAGRSGLAQLEEAGGGLRDDPIIGTTDLELKPMVARIESRQLELGIGAFDR